MINRYLLILLLLANCISCTKSNDENSDEIKALVLENESYGNHTRQKYDAYLPEGRNSEETSSLILIHGGSWISGDKSDLNIYLNTLKSRLPQLAYFNINYRYAIADNEKFPAQEKDIDAAIKKIISKKAEYQISDKYIVAGFSSGGQLSLLQAYKNYGENKPSGVISISGPTDLELLYDEYLNPATRILLQTVTGTDPVTNPKIYRESSPVTYAKEGIPPTLLLHGQLDSIVPVEQALLLKGLLQSIGTEHQTIIYPSAGHSFYGTNITDALNKIEEFLKLHLK